MLVVVVVERAQPDRIAASEHFVTTTTGIRKLRVWLTTHNVREVAMESTAQDWKPVWLELEGSFSLRLAQARSTAAPRGRKTDTADAFRIARRLLADDLTVSFVPDAEQRRWRLFAQPHAIDRRPHTDPKSD